MLDIVAYQHNERSEDYKAELAANSEILRRVQRKLHSEDCKQWEQSTRSLDVNSEAVEYIDIDRDGEHSTMCTHKDKW